MAYTTIDDPTDYFTAKIYTGNNSSQTITGVGFQPDWVWFKSRTTTDSHYLVDSVRGNTKYLRSQTTTAEETNSTAVTSFNSDGYALGSAGNVNDNANYVSWNWKAGGSASSNSDGSITSSVSANTTAGFSIVSWTGTGSAATIGHSIGVQPQIVFVKNRDDVSSWNVYTVFGGGGKGLFLNDSAAFDSDTSYFNNGTASTTTFPVGTANTSNGSSDNMIAYCFANVKGYSKIGSYTGNGNADGTFVYTGFKPSLVIAKSSSASHDWIILDNKRSNPFNPVDGNLFPNNADAEGTATKRFDFTSQGFKNRSAGTGANESGTTYIYMAFAESPFVTGASAIPTTAR